MFSLARLLAVDEKGFSGGPQARAAAEDAVDLVDGALADEPAKLLPLLDQGLDIEGRGLVGDPVELVVDEGLPRLGAQTGRKGGGRQFPLEQVAMVFPLPPHGGQHVTAAVDEEDVVEGQVVRQVVLLDPVLQLADGLTDLRRRRLDLLQLPEAALDVEVPLHDRVPAHGAGQVFHAGQVGCQLGLLAVTGAVQHGVGFLLQGDQPLGQGRAPAWKQAQQKKQDRQRSVCHGTPFPGGLLSAARRAGNRPLQEHCRPGARGAQ
jgi:hypothetical protein